MKADDPNELVNMTMAVVHDAVEADQGHQIQPANDMLVLAKHQPSVVVLVFLDSVFTHKSVT